LQQCSALLLPRSSPTQQLLNKSCLSPSHSS
jgi:hypothetical protein